MTRPSSLVIFLKLLATNENCEKQKFLSNLGPLPQRVGYFTQFEIFSHVGAPDAPTLT